MRSRYVGVGIFVVVGSLLFATTVFLIGNQHNFFSKHIELFTEVKNLNGLAKGAKIQVAGFDAGEVAEIGVPKSPAAGFKLTLRITDQVRGLIRTDSVATIATEGVVGDKILLIGPGSSTASEAAPHATLPFDGRIARPRRLTRLRHPAAPLSRHPAAPPAPPLSLRGFPEALPDLSFIVHYRERPREYLDYAVKTALTRCLIPYFSTFMTATYPRFL
jgi:hypothetical protein